MHRGSVVFQPIPIHKYLPLFFTLDPVHIRSTRSSPVIRPRRQECMAIPEQTDSDTDTNLHHGRTSKSQTIQQALEATDKKIYDYGCYPLISLINCSIVFEIQLCWRCSIATFTGTYTRTHTMHGQTNETKRHGFKWKCFVVNFQHRIGFNLV